MLVQRKIMFLPGEICLPKLLNGSGGTEPAKVRVNRAEVSRGREPSGMLLGKGLKAVWYGDIHELW